MTIGTLHAQDFTDQLREQYPSFKQASLNHRRFKHADLVPLIKQLPDMGYTVKVAGKSYQGRDIYHVSIGAGSQSVLMWSQMHGNEATATMALFDIFNYLAQTESEVVRHLLDNLTIHFIPMLNPDGAELFQRRTSQGFDMNRDALALQCPESRILKSLRDKLDADFGFNLHDQNIYYNVGLTGKPATISFLAPAYNQHKHVNPNREHAMKVIVAMNEALQTVIPGQVGKYDDTFEPRAFGDNIQKWGTRTILIESGGYPGDPEKQFIRELNFIAILTALRSIAISDYAKRKIQDYWEIPFNQSDLNDVIIRNIEIQHQNGAYQADLAIRREEYDQEGNTPLFYKGTIEDFGDLSTKYGYQEINGMGLVYAPGKLYPEVLEDQQAVLDLGVNKLLKQGYTYIKLEQQQQQETYQLPFDLITTELKLPSQPIPDQSATFLLLEHGKVKYTVINGFVHEGGHLANEQRGWVY